MNSSRIFRSNLIIALVLATITHKIDAYTFRDLINEKIDLTLDAVMRYRPESFWGKNLSLLNDCSDTDRLFYVRHTFDFEFDARSGKQLYGYNIVEFKFAMRNKAVWGNPNSIASTTESSVKLVDTIFGAHRHDEPRLYTWLRELWVSASLGDILGLDICNEQDVTLGAFPFQVGRGIALGDAYSITPELLGFYTETAVDQYAFGGLLNGDIIAERLSYDLYTAILLNRSGTLTDTNAKIFSQEFGRMRCPARGFGKINFITAFRFNWFVFNNERWGKCFAEPYIVYNHDSEQRVEFLGDASMRLATAGLACEYTGKPFEFGFDIAFNFGHQSVKGWDRNHVDITSNNSFLQQINTNVVDQNGVSMPFVAGSAAQNIIFNSPQGEEFNGQQIGVVNTGFADLTPPIDIINAKNRFRNPFCNELLGRMFVFDMGYWVIDKDLFVAATAGFATGDDHPNFDTKDGDFEGFIGLQEIYSGKRVKSAFLMGGAGKVKRLLSAPGPDVIDQAPSPFPSVISGFTNLVFTGFSALWKPQGRKLECSIMPNIIFYWQEFASKKFDLATKMESPTIFARNFLGTEINLFTYVNLLKSLKAFFVGSVFIPGGHYKDIRGKPINKDQLQALNNVLDGTLDDTGFTGDVVPNIGADPAVTLNFGIEYSF